MEKRFDPVGKNRISLFSVESPDFFPWAPADSRSCLGLGGTLSNILAMKLAHQEELTPCYKFRTSDDLLESSKKAASSYNREHK